uniref:BZIP domain-containing protein n=1 Tax=Acrobeloides nanus TaxID=290746 RepID=A0A914E5Q4_9BILA
MVGGDKDSFESWALDRVDLNNFDLINFIGADEETNDNVEYGSTEQDRKQNREDKLYTTHQYNAIMFNDFNDTHNGQYEGYENQYPGVSNYVGTSTDTRGILSNSAGYSNVVDSSMIPTTSKSSIPMPIKMEPKYEHIENVGTMAFDDSGAYSDAESYAHSVSSAGAYQDGTFHPKTKPRKYRVKPVEEKLNPVYKVKREKNNDAVRRSRDKAKRIQLEKEERLTFLEQETVKKDRMIQQQNATIEKLKQQVNMIARQCSCGAAAPSRM